MFRLSKQNRRKPNYGRRAKFSIACAIANALTLGVLLNARAQDAEIARIEAQPQQHRAKPHPTATPPPLPAIPAGLQIGNRQIVRQETGTPAVLQLGGFDLTALTTTPQGHHSSSKSPLWIDSDQSGIVAVCESQGVLPLDRIGAADDVLSVRVHDQQGNVVTFSQRAYHTPYAGAVESPLCAVRVDEAGSLLPLAIVRVEQAEDGSVRVTRDSDFSEPLIVHYRFVRSGDNPKSYQYAQNVIIPAGAATSQPLPIQANAGDVLTLDAGFYYSPAPAEGSDVLTFASK